MVDGRRALLVGTCGGWPNKRGCRCQHTPYSMCLVGLLFQDNIDLYVASSCIAAERCPRMTGSATGFVLGVHEPGQRGAVHAQRQRPADTEVWVCGAAAVLAWGLFLLLKLELDTSLRWSASWTLTARTEALCAGLFCCEVFVVYEERASEVRQAHSRSQTVCPACSDTFSIS